MTIWIMNILEIVYLHCRICRTKNFKANWNSLLILSFLVIFLIIFDSFINKNNLKFYSFFEYIFVLFTLFIFIVFLYKLTTPKRIKITKLLIGSLFSTIGIGGGIFIYSYYLKNISSTLSYFGPLSSVALLFLILLQFQFQQIFLHKYILESYL